MLPLNGVFLLSIKKPQSNPTNDLPIIHCKSINEKTIVIKDIPTTGTATPTPAFLSTILTTVQPFPMSRTIQLSFSEWKQINKEVPNNYYFNLGPGSISEWKKYLKINPENNCSFPRVCIIEIVEKLKSPVLINTLCKKYWRDQDMCYVMDTSHNFIGFILNHIDEIDFNTTLQQWEEIRNKMNVVIHSGDKENWTVKELVELFTCCSSDTLSSAVQIC